MNRPEEWAHKLSEVRRWLAKTGAAAVLIEGQGAFAWLTCGGDSHVSLGQQEGCASVLVTRDRVFLLAANNEAPRILEEELSQLPLEPVTFPWYQPTRARSLVAGFAGSGPVVSDLGQLGFARADPSFPALRFTLLPPEVERYRRVGQDAAEAVEIACEEARPGQPEREVAARIVHGLHASLTRMVSAGKPDEDLSARMAAVQRVDAALLLSSRPGISLGEVLARGQAQYAAEGHPSEWELHHQGGLTGYGGRERFATPGEPLALGPGQAVAWNPSITRVKSEDTALVTGDGPELLTVTPRWPRVEVRLPEGTVERPALRVLGTGNG